MSSIDDHEGDTLILILKGRLLAYGIPTRDNYAPLWLKGDVDLNYLTYYNSPNGPTTDLTPEKCVQLGPKGKALDVVLFHALKRCVQGPLLLVFYRVTKQSYMQVALLMFKQFYYLSPRAKIQVLASMLNTSWKGDVDQWRSELMERHMEIGKFKFTYREISLLGVMMSAERFSPTLFSQVALIITEMRPSDSFDDDITKICLLAQQYQGIADSERCGLVPHQDIVPWAERPVSYDEFHTFDTFTPWYSPFSFKHQMAHSLYEYPLPHSLAMLHPPRFPICGFCGKSNHDRKDCFAENPCNTCGKIGHFAITCRTKKPNKALNICVEDMSELSTDKSYRKLLSVLLLCYRMPRLYQYADQHRMRDLSFILLIFHDPLTKLYTTVTQGDTTITRQIQFMI